MTIYDGGNSNLVLDGGDADPSDDEVTPPLYLDECWPVETSCVPDWDEQVPDTSEGADEDDTVPKYSDDAKARAVALAGQTMRLLTAFRVGGCPVTVRPCRAGCSERTWRTYPVAGFSGSTPWFPVNLGGSWLNIGCGHAGGCSCSLTHEVRLHGSPSVVTQVKIDGDVLPETSYRLDPGGRLVRLDGTGWPLCQNLDAPDTEEGTWSVSYVPGAPVDRTGAIAAGLLAGEYVKACTGGDCELPKTVTQIVRNGVQMTMAPGAFPNGKTGIQYVDAYLERWNPDGDRGPRSDVWSPDIARPRAVGS